MQPSRLRWESLGSRWRLLAVTCDKEEMQITLKEFINNLLWRWDLCTVAEVEVCEERAGDRQDAHRLVRAGSRER